MKKCKFPRCGKRYFGRGLCQGHYTQKVKGKKLIPLKKVVRSVGKYKETDICEFPECGRKMYAKGLCGAHYYQKKLLSKMKSLRFKNKGQICRFKQCHGKAKVLGYCTIHYERHRRHGDASVYKGHKGENNPNWNGGVFDYPDHYKMKKARKKIIAKRGKRCELCGKRRKLVMHHKDGSKSNHKLSNLILVCGKCHCKFHPKKREGNTFLKLLAEHLDLSSQTVKNYFYKPETLAPTTKALLSAFL